MKNFDHAVCDISLQKCTPRVFDFWSDSFRRRDFSSEAVGAGERAEKERRGLSAGDGEARGSRGQWGARWYDVRLTFVFLNIFLD
jgi:hypothetical protein